MIRSVTLTYAGDTQCRRHTMPEKHYAETRTLCRRHYARDTLFRRHTMPETQSAEDTLCRGHTMPETLCQRHTMPEHTKPGKLCAFPDSAVSVRHSSFSILRH